MAQVTHHIIADAAKAIARESYEGMAHENEFYAEWPNREQFVAANWRMFVEGARAALLKILSGDYPDAMKEPIYEAMLIDGSLKAQPGAPKSRAKTRIIH